MPSARPSPNHLPQPSGELRRLPNALGQAALLEWLGQSPIAFHRVYVDLTGGVLPALWLSSAMDRVAKANASSFEVNGDYVFAMSAQECETATGITRAQQATCRKQLVEMGLISEQAEQAEDRILHLIAYLNLRIVVVSAVKFERGNRTTVTGDDENCIEAALAAIGPHLLAQQMPHV